MRLKDIPYYEPLNREQVEYLLVLGALKKRQNKVAIKGLNKPTKKWNLQEIELYRIKGMEVPA